MKILRPVHNNPEQLHEMAMQFFYGIPIERTITEDSEPEQFDNTFHYEVIDDTSEQKE